VRFSSSKRQSHPRSARVDPDWFTPAAVERIATCVCDYVGSEKSAASAIVSRYRGTSDSHGLADDDFEDPSLDSITGFHQTEAVQFYTFVGLIELAARAGYVDLAAWEGVPSLPDALKKFEEAEAVSEQATDLTLIRGLLSRLELKQNRVTTLDDKAFYAFASYVHLTSAIRKDETCQKFIAETKVHRFVETKQFDTPLSDLSFLVSPAHFSEALAVGSVAGVPSLAVKSGLATLRYFQWLTEILVRVEHDSDLRDCLIRHARWSHHILRVRRRLDVWAKRMREWDERRAQEDAPPLDKAMRDALGPSHDDLKRLGLLKRAGLTIEPEQTIIETRPDTERLIAEGRKDAAIQRLCEEAARIDLALQEARARSKPIASGADDLVSVCEQLTQLGVVDAASVFLARHVDVFGDQFDVNKNTTDRALALLAQARARGDTRPEILSEVEPPIPIPHSQSTAPPVTHRYRSVGQSDD
jgi:hypothetical protein